MGSCEGMPSWLVKMLKLKSIAGQVRIPLTHPQICRMDHPACQYWSESSHSDWDSREMGGFWKEIQRARAPFLGSNPHTMRFPLHMAHPSFCLQI